MKNFIRYSILTAAFSVAGFAADLTGFWTCEIPSRAATSQDVTFRFIQEGDKIKGKLYNSDSSSDMEFNGGTVTGNTFTFEIHNEGYSGKTTFLYSGEIKEGEMHLNRETDNSFTRSDPEARKKSKQTLVLKKLL